MTPKLFSELGLSPEVLKAIDKLGFEQAAPIQASAIPILMSGGDVVGQSQTGSGKTAAFAIPAIEKVDTRQRGVQVLILCPTRELAIQVSEEVHKLALFKSGLHALPIYGGQSFDRQLAGLKQGANIVIGTPGRVMDHMRRGTLKLAGLKIVILDEVDVMLNMGFRDDIEVILQAAPSDRQTVFFSATIPRPIQQLIEKYSRNPQQVRIEQKALTVPTVEQIYYEVDRNYKIELLTRLIDIHDLKLGIIFCNTRRMVDDLVEHLNAQGYSADRLHGEMSQAMRDRVMNRFRKSGLEFLVATDVAARGIDVENIEVVFNYDLPYDGEDYVHRIGRTGRQGRSGRAISFASGREVFQIRTIERYTNTRIHRGHPPTQVEVEEARANTVLDKIRATLKSGEYKRQDQLIARLLEEGFSSTDIASVLLHHLQGGEGSPEDKRTPEKSSSLDREPRGSREDRGGSFQRQPGRYGEERASHRSAAAGPRLRPHPPQAKEGFQPEERRRERGADKSAGPRAAAPSHPPERSHSQKEAAVRKSSTSPKPFQRPLEPQTRLFMNVGAEMGISEPDVVEAVQGVTGLQRDRIGRVDVRERHLFFEVASDQAQGIAAKLNRSLIKGLKIKVKVA